MRNCPFIRVFDFTASNAGRSGRSRLWLPMFMFACALSVLLNPSTCGADEITFGDFSQWESNRRDVGSAPTISILQQRIQITNEGSSDQARSLFYDHKVNIAKEFTATYRYWTTGPELPPTNAGLTFTIHNSTGGTSNVGYPAQHLGYSGLLSPVFNKSLALSLELEATSRTGLYQDGQKGSALGEPTGMVDLNSGRTMTVTIHYTGTVLSQTIFDESANKTFATDYLVDIPDIVGAEMAYIGFTASTGYSGWTYDGRRNQFISHFRFTNVPEPSSVVMFAMGSLGIGLAARFRSRRRK